MAKILVDILAYRDWAIDLAQSVLLTFYGQHEICWHRDYENHHKEADLTFLVGWSDIVPESFYDNRMVLVLHPSPLPKYRGGSPIQHQIIAGETDSEVSLFRLHPDYPEVDSGPIYRQHMFSLEGSLKNVLYRITDAGQFLVEQAIKEFASTGKLELTPQDESQATTFKRRKPEESEITHEELASLTAKHLYDKVRALQDPYPNAFIKTAYGEKLYITEAHL